MKRLNVSDTYDIIIDKGLINNCGEYIRKVTDAKRAAVISDSNVSAIYAHTVLQSLEKEGFETSLFVFSAGESNKTMDTVNDMLNFMADKHLTRKDIVVALGGGVTGDLAGFASAIYLRGIDFVQIPTSLLAQLDSSVGGKTGCDLQAGKNLAGAFHQPSAVIIDTDTLSTLPDKYMIDGMGEAIKYGCISSQKLFAKLESEPIFSFTEEMIYDCVSIKAKAVENDFYEKGERILLNFGHTMGHAIEKYLNFSGISHGCAVGIGMVMMAQACEKLCIAKPGTTERIKRILRKYGLPISTDADLSKLCEIALSDKKCRDDYINLVAISDIGKCFVKPVSGQKLFSFMEGVEE